MENKVKIIETNRADVVGTMTDWDLKEGSTKDGRDYISGRVTIKSIIDNREQITEVELFTMKMTKAGAVSKMYTAYQNSKELLNERVAVQGELVENKFWQNDQNQVVTYTRISGRFVNKARADETDKATFKVVGYVVQPLTEVLDSEDNVINHRIILGISNYNQTLPNYITLTINDRNIAKAVESMYAVGDTVELEGNYIVSTETVEKPRESAFGELTDSSTRTFKQFVINSGSHPIEAGAYPAELIQTLTAGYKADLVKVEEEGKERASENKAFGANTTKPKTGLGARLL